MFKTILASAILATSLSVSAQHQHNDSGISSRDLAGAIVIGAIGAAVVNNLNQNPQPVYVEPPRFYAPPPVIIYQEQIYVRPQPMYMYHDHSGFYGEDWRQGRREYNR